MNKLEIPKRESGEVIFQTRLNLEKATQFKEVAKKHGFKVSDILRSGIDLFLSQYSNTSKSGKR